MTFEDIFQDFFKPLTPEQQTCSHILASQMPDGKWFCPSCRLVSERPLKEAMS